MKQTDNGLDIIFKGTKRSIWLGVVSNNFNIPQSTNDAKVYVRLNNISNIEEIEPFHLVLLACLRQSLKDKGYNNCYLTTDNSNLLDYLAKDLNLGQYWLGKNPENHTESPDETIFNLWRVSDSEKEDYSNKIRYYLKSKFFQNKDLSSVQLSLLEIFYNIFDHADADYSGDIGPLFWSIWGQLQFSRFHDKSA